MNRFLMLALTLCSLSEFSQAQDYQTCIQVISSTGKTATQGGLTFSYTVGEPSITTLAGSSRIVTQGFHQPELCQVVSTHNFDLANWNVEVFPNPTSDFLTVRYSTEKGITLHATVFNLLGQVMLDNRLLAPSTGTQIDCAEWQPGVYILQLKDPVTSNVAALRFIRL